MCGPSLIPRRERHTMQPTQTIVTNLDGETTNLSIERQLSSNAAPGQARGRTGLATGSGSLTLVSNTGRPWSTHTPATGPITINAKADIGQPSHRVFTGEITRINGTAANPTLSADIQDQRLNKTPTNIQTTFLNNLFYPDATHLIRTALEALGYHAAPPRQKGDTLWLPLHGTPADPHGRGLLGDSGNGATWANINGEAAAHIRPATALSYYLTWNTDSTNHPTTYVNVQLEPGSRLNIKIFGTTIGILRTETNQWKWVANGVELFFDWTAPTGNRGTLAIALGGGLTNRIAAAQWVSPDGSMNPLVGYAAGSAAATPDALVFSSTSGNAYVYWAVMRNSGPPAFTPNAFLEATGFTLSNVFAEELDDAWAYAQQVAEQTVSALIRREDGTIALKAKEHLRGINTPSTKVLGVDNLANLDWVKDFEEAADRVEQYFTPVEWSGATETVWEAETIIRIPANGFKNVKVSLDGVNADGYLPFDQALTDPPELTKSRWIAFTTASGTSPMPAATALKITATARTPNEGNLRIENTTNQTLWIRTEGGNPALWLRSNNATRKGEQELIEIGASKETARNTFTHDAGTSIQNYTDASNLAAWWWANLAGEPRPQINSINVLFDPSLKVADIITIYDPLFTHIRARALITRVNHDISADTHHTNIDVALLAVTALDVAKYFTAINPTMTALQRAQWLQAQLGSTVTALQAAQWLEDNTVEI